MAILKLLATDNFITVNRTLAAIVGLEAAVILGELASEYNYWRERDGLDEDGFFFSTVENLERRTFLSAHSQRQALGILQEMGFVEVKKKGMPARRYITLNESQIARHLILLEYEKEHPEENERAESIDNQSLKFLTTSDSNFEQQDVQIFNDIKRNNNKTIEKEKRKRNIYIDILDEVPQIRNDENLRRTFVDFIEMRKFIKAPLTERALRMIISDTIKLGEEDPDRMRAILEQSIKNNWKGVFPIKKPRPETTTNPFTELLTEEGYT